VIGGVLAASLLVSAAVGLRWLLSDTPGMAILKSTGMVGYTPDGANRTFYSETEEGKDWLGGGRDDEVLWCLAPPRGRSVLDLLGQLDRAAERAGFTDVETPLGEHPDPMVRPGGTSNYFARRRSVHGVAVVFSGWVSPDECVQVIMRLEPGPGS